MTESNRFDRADILFRGGRVIDPESGMDELRCVGVTDGRIVSITVEPVEAATVVDIAGLVLAPGFIDLHSHAQSITGLRLQAMDGVTTALELEGGALPVDLAYSAAEQEGRPINFGFSAAWLAARAHVLDDMPLWREAPPSLLPTALNIAAMARAHIGGGSRTALPGSKVEVDRIIGLLSEELDSGAIGIGALLGYLPGSGRDEFIELGRLAASRRMSVFTHPRHLSEREPDTSLSSVLEVIGVAAATGASMHVCHLNSSSLRMIDRVTDAVANARAQGMHVTTEAYPYGTGSTAIGAEYLAPELLPRMGISPSSIRYLATGERVVDADRLRELRATDPEGLCLVDILDLENPADVKILLEGILFPETAIASDAMPLVPFLPGRDGPDAPWPPEPGQVTHPRSVGCYARLLGWVVREHQAMTLAEAIARATIVPARILEDAVPAMRSKGRVAVGADADLVVFDPETVSDRATITSPAPSSGFAHVMVGGSFVVRDGALDPHAHPGKAVRAGV